MAQLRLYNPATNVEHLVDLTTTKETTPALKVGNLYAPLGNFADSVIPIKFTNGSQVLGIVTKPPLKPATKYKMSNLYPSIYQTMTDVPSDFALDGYLITTASMFSGCSSLTSIPQLDTSNATNMGDMFSGCSSLTSIPQLDTSNATSMSYMFQNCSSLTSIPWSIDLSSISNGAISNVKAMFLGCTNLSGDIKFKNVPSAIVPYLTRNYLGNYGTYNIVIENII